MMEPRVLVVVPVYNHAATLRGVVEGALARHPDVLVVDDGSGDDPRGAIAGLGAAFLSHPSNRGKGEAIRTAAAEARRLGMTHLVTIDADGQHDPADLPLFLEAIRRNPAAIVVGVRDFEAARVPGSSRFGRSFSNFWLRVQTGRELADTQSGFRAYPLEVLERLPLGERGFSFEIEVLVRAAWAGVPFGEVPVAVQYPADRVSHFDKFLDNLRLAHLNTRLTMRSVTPWPHRTLETAPARRVSLLHPWLSLRSLLTENATPARLGQAAALGVFLGTLPLIGVHTLAIILAAAFLRLNKVAAVAASQLCMPPVVPALAVETGYFLRHGRLLTEVSFQTVGREFLQRLAEWLIGSLILAPLLALIVGGLVWGMALAVRRSIDAPR